MDFHGLSFKLEHGKRMPYSPMRFSNRDYSTIGNYNYHPNNVMNMTKNVCDLISNLSGTKLMPQVPSPVGGSRSCDPFSISFSDVVRGVMGSKSQPKPPEINNFFGIMGQFVQIFDVPNVVEVTSDVRPSEDAPLKCAIRPESVNGQTHLFNSSLNDSNLVNGLKRRSYAEVTKEKPLFSRKLQVHLSAMSRSAPVCLSKPAPAVSPVSSTDNNEEKQKPVTPLTVLVTELSLDSSKGSDDSVNERLHSNSLSSESDASDCLLDPARRRPRRTLSECSVDSDDSFIVFEEDGIQEAEDDWSDGEGSSDESECENNNDLIPCSLEDDGCEDCSEKAVICKLCSEEDPLDEICGPNLAEVNERWNRYYPDDGYVRQSSPKVKFAEGKKLAVIRPLITWSYAHHRARIGHWMQTGRDRERFKEKIASLSQTLNRVLTPQHRQTIYNQRFKPFSDT